MVGILDDGTSGVHLHAKNKNGSSSHTDDVTVAETPTAFTTRLYDLLHHCFPSDITYSNPFIRHNTNAGQARINKNAGGPRRSRPRSESIAPTPLAPGSFLTSETLRTTEANPTGPKLETTVQTSGVPGSFSFKNLQTTGSKSTTSFKDTARAGVPGQPRKPVKNKNKDGPRPTAVPPSGKIHEESQNLQQAPLTSKSGAETDNGKIDDDATGVAVIDNEIVNETYNDYKRQAAPVIEDKQTIGGDQAVSKEQDEINIRDKNVDTSVEKTIQRPQPSQEPRVDTVRPGLELNTQFVFDNPLYQ